MSAPTLALYVSGHGFGHAARTAALAAALRRAAPGARLLARSDGPLWLLEEADPALETHPGPVDPGVVQRDALRVDWPATEAAWCAWVAEWDVRADAEAGWLRDERVDAVVADVPPLAFAAAARAGVPAFAVANFGWDWILASRVARAPALASAVARIRTAYAAAHTLFRLPCHGPLPAFRRVVDVPHLTRRAERPRGEVRAELGLAPDDARPLVLVSFGGFGRDDLAGAADAPDDLSGFALAGFGAPPGGLAEAWRTLSHGEGPPHVDLVAAADAVIGKTGYGTVAEVLVHRSRLLYVPRPGWPEAAVLEAGLARDGCAAALGRDDFAAGRWRAALEALLARPRPPRAPARDGAERIAAALLARLGVGAAPSGR